MRLKRLILILLGFSLISCLSLNAFASTETTPEQAEGLLGDVNDDGKINAEDALLILKHVAKIEIIDTTPADVSFDSKIDAQDALLVLKYAAGIIPGFTDDDVTSTPVPTATPGIYQEEIDNNVKQLKEYITENGFDENTGLLYLAYQYGDDVYCIIGYDTSSDSLFAEISYFTTMNDGISIMAAASIDNFPYSTEAEYYEEFYNDSDAGYITAKTEFTPANITNSEKFTFTETESINYSDEDKAAVFKTAGTFLLSAFSIWDEVLELETEFTLNDFGFSNYTRE